MQHQWERVQAGVVEVCNHRVHAELLQKADMSRQRKTLHLWEQVQAGGQGLQPLTSSQGNLDFLYNFSS